MIRIFKHILSGIYPVGNVFSKDDLDLIEKAILNSEKNHSGEICFVVHDALSFYDLIRGKTAHQEALRIFSEMRVWDTESNNGVLIYLLLADKNFEIVADRGIHKHVDTTEWEIICKVMEDQFSKGNHCYGVLEGVRLITEKLKKHFPGTLEDRNVLSDKPIVTT